MDSITTMLSGIIPAGFKITDIFGIVAAKLCSVLPAGLVQFYFANQLMCNFALICLLMLLAVEGYKIFKMALYAGGAFAFAYLGYLFLVPKIPASILSMIPPVVKPQFAVALACGLVALLLTRFARSLMMMILGGALGYYIGSTTMYGILVNYFNTLKFLQNDITKAIVGGVFAAIMAILFLLLFKHAFIIVSSIGGAATAAYLLYPMVIAAQTDSIRNGFLIGGVIIGVICLIRQYREEQKAQELII